MARIFLVGDNESIREAVAGYLRLDEHEVAEFGRVLSWETLLGECLGYSYEGSERTIDTHVKNLRAKLGGAERIEPVRSYGYRFAGIPAAG